MIGGAVVVIAAGGYGATQFLTGRSGPVHHITTPQKLLAYTQNPELAKSLGAPQLRAEVVAKSGGEASHVVDAVYEDSTGPAAKTGPQIVLFVGGNLSGSASSFIASFTGMPGAFTTGSGHLGGMVACVPGTGGHPAECAWADNDTFGLIASPTTGASALGTELRQMRPLIEHRAA